MAKLLSYLYPITKKIESEYSGTLEVTWYNGKKLLNTKNANYSYGSLQRILKYSLEKINLKSVHSVLVLGLGGGSVIETLRTDFSYDQSITAVDIDLAIIQIAKDEFDLKEDEQLKIICEDALVFMQQNKTHFDLIIIDLFIDTEVPTEFLSLSFWRHINDASTANGTILFNAALEKTNSKALNEVIEFLKAHKYQTEVYEKVNDTNTLIISKGL